MNEDAISFEAFQMEELIKSRNTAWIFSIVFAAIAVLAMGTLFFIMPLKEIIPVVIKENVTTGESRIITVLDKQTFTTEEVTDKASASDYVKKREQYYYDILAKDYYQVLLYSNKKTQRDYQTIYQGEKSRDKLLSNRYKVETTIISVVLSESSGTKIATVRGSSVTIDVDTSIKSNKTYFVSTVAYKFDPNKIMKAEDRMLNPLGYTVLTYRKDTEISQ